MPRFLLGWVLGLGANAIALILCALLFGDDFKFTSIMGFIVAVVVFPCDPSTATNFRAPAKFASTSDRRTRAIPRLFASTHSALLSGIAADATTTSALPIDSAS